MEPRQKGNRPAADGMDKTAVVQANYARVDAATMTNMALFSFPPGPGSLTLYTADYVCTQEGEWLNDNAIDFYLRWLVLQQPTEVQQEIHVYSTHFFTQLTRKGYQATPSEQFEGVKRWTKRVNITQKTYLVIPVNEAHHWFLAIVCLRRQPRPDNTRGYIWLLDSLARRTRQHVAAPIRGYLQCVWQAAYPETPQGTWTPETMPYLAVTVPQQNNFADCGVFLLHFMEKFLQRPNQDLREVGGREWFPPAEARHKRQELATLMRNLTPSHLHSALPPLRFAESILPAEKAPVDPSTTTTQEHEATYSKDDHNPSQLPSRPSVIKPASRRTIICTDAPAHAGPAAYHTEPRQQPSYSRPQPLATCTALDMVIKIPPTTAKRAITPHDPPQNSTEWIRGVIGTGTAILPTPPVLIDEPTESDAVDDIGELRETPAAVLPLENVNPPASAQSSSSEYRPTTTAVDIPAGPSAERLAALHQLTQFIDKRKQNWRPGSRMRSKITIGAIDYRVIISRIGAVMILERPAK